MRYLLLLYDDADLVAHLPADELSASTVSTSPSSIGSARTVPT